MCAVDICKRPAYAKGYCNAHYQRHRRGAAMTTPIRDNGKGSRVIACDMPHGGPCRLIWPVSRFAWCERCKAR